MASSSIDILLATFNGAKWLPALLASLEAQTCQDWRLLVRDDGSSDDTPALLDGLESRFGGRMVRVRAPKTLPGAMGSFDQLLAASTAPYVMFCDQDDVWLPAKVARTMEAMARMEALHGPDTPVLVFTDLRVVDAELRTLADSFWKVQCLRPSELDFPRLLVQNMVTGCTAMANRVLVRRACPIPPGAFMHDWWFALVAAAYGHLAPISEPLILYRQHGANAIGIQSTDLWSSCRRIANGEVANYLRTTSSQAAAMLQRFDRGLGRWRPSTEALASLCAQSWLSRKQRMLKHRLFICGWARNLMWLLVT